LQRDEFGSVALYLMLSTRLDQKAALAAADGWGGDEYVVYRADERVCVGMQIEGDDPAESTQISDALEQWAAQSPEGTTQLSVDGSQVLFETCDPGPDAEAVGDGASPDVLALPTARTFFYGQALAGGNTPDVALCFATAMVERLAVDQLNGAFVQSDDGVALVGQVIRSCQS
jgi:hypothetical protein